MVLGPGEDDQKVHHWLKVTANIPGFIGLGPHRLLGAIGKIAIQPDNAGGCRDRDSQPLPGVRRIFEVKARTA